MYSVVDILQLKGFNMHIAVSLSAMENRVQKGQSLHLTGIT